MILCADLWAFKAHKRQCLAGSLHRHNPFSLCVTSRSGRWLHSMVLGLWFLLLLKAAQIWWLVFPTARKPSFSPAAPLQPGACRDWAVWKKCHGCTNQMHLYLLTRDIFSCTDLWSVLYKIRVAELWEKSDADLHEHTWLLPKSTQTQNWPAALIRASSAHTCFCLWVQTAGFGIQVIALIYVYLQLANTSSASRRFLQQTEIPRGWLVSLGYSIWEEQLRHFHLNVFPLHSLCTSKPRSQPSALLRSRPKHVPSCMGVLSCHSYTSLPVLFCNHLIQTARMVDAFEM